MHFSELVKADMISKKLNMILGMKRGGVFGLDLPRAAAVNEYTMNAGTSLKWLEEWVIWDGAFRQYVRQLRKEGRPLVVMGSLNVGEGGDVMRTQCRDWQALVRQNDRGLRISETGGIF